MPSGRSSVCVCMLSALPLGTWNHRRKALRFDTPSFVIALSM